MDIGNGTPERLRGRNSLKNTPRGYEESKGNLSKERKKENQTKNLQ